jgi:hypothetical protein
MVVTMCEVSQVLKEIGEGEGVSLPSAAPLLPVGRGGGPPSESTLRRWARCGRRSAGGALVRLEAARFAERWLTSRPAVRRFLEKLTGCGGSPAS